MLRSNRGRIVLLAIAAVLGAVVVTAPGNANMVGTWELRAPSGVTRQEVSYVRVGGKFYAAGGRRVRHQAYNAVTNKWSDVAPLPASLDHIQAVTHNGLIYYIGGLSRYPSPHVNTVYIYNPATNAFSQGAPMRRGRGAGGVAVYNGKIYYAGGLHNGAPVAWFDVYNPATNKWRQLPDMPRPRDHFHAAVVNGKFFAIGGRAGTADATTGANDAYTFGARAWATGLEPLPSPRGGYASAVIGNEVFVIGGEGGGIAHDEVEAYNTINDTWRSLTPMPTPRHGIQAVVCNGGIYIANGGLTQGGGNPTDIHEVLFPKIPATCGP